MLSETDCSHTLMSLDNDVVKTYNPYIKYICSSCKNHIHEHWMDLIVDDTGWILNIKTSIPQRGISDYDRYIKFSQALSLEEKENVRQFLGRVDCPGWTTVNVYYNVSSNNYAFTTTYDSSD